MLLRILSMFALIILLSGCGPSRSNLEKENDQIRLNVQKKREELSAVTGVYRGRLLRDDGALEKAVRLTIFPLTIPVTNPGRSDISQVPTLGGSLLTQDSTGAESLSLAQYTSGDFSAQTQSLVLYGTVNGSQFFLEGTFTGKGIEGRVHTPFYPNWRLEVLKVEDQ